MKLIKSSIKNPLFTSRWLRYALLATLLTGLLPHKGSAQIVAEFTGGDGVDSVDQFPGIAGLGWFTAWEVGGSQITTPTVIATDPLTAGGGNYLSVLFTGDSESAVRRKYVSFGDFGVDQSLPVVIDFDIRVEPRTGWNDPSDNVSITARRSATGTGPGGDSAWWIKTQGLNDSGAPLTKSNVWNFFVGSPTSTGTGAGQGYFTNYGTPLLFGTNYHFTIEQRPASKTYIATVSYVTNGVAISNTTPELLWRNFSGATESNGDATNTTSLVFAGRAKPTATEDTPISLDNIRVTQAPLDGVAPFIKVATPLASAIQYPASSNLVFSAFTLGPTNTIPTANVTLILNGVNVSGGLSFDGDPTNRTVTYSGLVDNTIYNGSITIADQAGRSAAKTLFFDTFTSSVTTIEAENYNFGTNAVCTHGGIDTPATEQGSYLQNPLPSDGDGTGSTYTNQNEGYVDRVGLKGVDYFDFNPLQISSDFVSDYRYCDGMDTRSIPGAEYTRTQSGYDSTLGPRDFALQNLRYGEWLNYTHVFPATTYRVYLRVAARVIQTYQLSRVTSDRKLPNQTSVVLGTFSVPITASRDNFTYIALTDAFGVPVSLHLSGEETLRLTSLNALDANDTYVNFILFDPQGAAVNPPYVADFSPNGYSQFSYAPGLTASNVPPLASVNFGIVRGSSPVSLGTIGLKIDGTDVTATSTIATTPTGAAVNYLPPSPWVANTFHTAQVTYGDGSADPRTNQISFHVGVFNFAPIHINFEKTNITSANAAFNLGYLSDGGHTFGTRGNGYSYGWDRDIREHGRESGSLADRRLNTFQHLNKISPPSIWEINIPDGTYIVHLVCGEAVDFTSHIFKISLEGIPFLDGISVDPPATAHFVETNHTVKVTGGRLTLAPGGNSGTALGGQNNKVTYIDIISANDPALDLTLHNPMISGSDFSFSITTLTNSANHIIEYKDDLGSSTWTELTNIVGNGSSAVVHDTVPADGRFYRMRIP